MPPRESDPLVGSTTTTTASSSRSRSNNGVEEGEPYHKQFSMDGAEVPDARTTTNHQRKYYLIGGALVMVGIWIWIASRNPVASTSAFRHATGPYRLSELQQGKQFFEYYDFFDGPDSIGSAGYQSYVGKDRAIQKKLANVTVDDEDGEEYIYMQSVAGAKKGGFRESVRLEGKRRFDRGLFILDVAHMPAGCGIWPAFWMTDEAQWPDNGEIDIVEGINTQSVVKTALHTSESCSMFAQVPAWVKTGTWDTSTGLPDTYTGIPSYLNRLEADNCWVMAPHQWANQGCVAVSAENGTIGEPMNANGGGVYVLEWDPVNGYIKSWVFKKGDIPENLELSMRTASDVELSNQHNVLPDPESWPMPYAYFAIGARSGCSNDHFKNMRLVFNLAFCGTVAGNRFFKDCPALAQEYNVSNDSVLTCNAYVASEPKALEEAYWKIRGVYVYEREYESTTLSNATSTKPF